MRGVLALVGILSLISFDALGALGGNGSVLPAAPGYSITSMGGHALGGEFDLKPENEWLYFDPDHSPTSRSDGGRIEYDYCSLGLSDIYVALDVLTPHGYAEVSFSKSNCNGALFVPFQHANYKIDVYDGVGFGRGELIYGQEFPYMATWIAVIGDSYSSGEGAPELETIDPDEALTWVQNKGAYCAGIYSSFGADELMAAFIVKNCQAEPVYHSGDVMWRRGVGGPHPKSQRDCHRSSKSWAFQAGLLLQDMWKVPVDISLHACSGATIGAPNYDPIQPSGQVLADSYYQGSIDEQLETLAEQIKTRGRVPDLLLMTVGGNDVGFSTLISRCYKASAASVSGCDFSRTCMSGVACGDDDEFHLNSIPVLDAMDNLSLRYDGLASKIDGLGISADRVFLAAPPIPPKFGVDWDVDCILEQSDLTAARDQFAKPLIDQMKKSSAKWSWNFIDASGAINFHNYCSSDPWIHNMVTSYQTQGDYWGTFHPTARGYFEMAKIAKDAIDYEFGLSVLNNMYFGSEHLFEDSKDLVMHQFNGVGGAITVLVEPQSEVVSDYFTIQMQKNGSGDDGIVYEMELDGVSVGGFSSSVFSKPGELITEHVVRVRRFKSADMPMFKLSDDIYRGYVELPSTEFKITQISPVELRKLVSINVYHYLSDTMMPLDVASLFGDFAPEIMPAGGYVGDVDLVFGSLGDFVDVVVDYNCGTTSVSGSKVSGYPTVKVAGTSGTVVAQPRLGAFESYVDVLVDGACWGGAPEEPESVLMRPTLFIQGREFKAKSKLHFGVFKPNGAGADVVKRASWHRAVDVAYGSVGAQGVRLDALCQDTGYDIKRGKIFNETTHPEPQLNQYGGVDYLMPYSARKRSAEWIDENLQCSDASGNRIVGQLKHGLGTLHVIAYPEPVWTWDFAGPNVKDYGTYIKGTRVEIEHLAMQSGKADSEVVFEEPWDLRFDGISAQYSHFFPNIDRPGRYVVRTYACLNDLARCQSGLALSSESENAQLYGYGLIREDLVEFVQNP